MSVFVIVRASSLILPEPLLICGYVHGIAITTLVITTTTAMGVGGFSRGTDITTTIDAPTTHSMCITNGDTNITTVLGYTSICIIGTCTIATESTEDLTGNIVIMPLVTSITMLMYLRTA